VAEEPLKQRALRSFQISQATKANKVSAPLRLSPCHLSLQFSHQVSQLSAPICDASEPRVAKTIHQICRENEQVAMMWSIVSGSWSQR
jgi:hypothetical protein